MTGLPITFVDAFLLAILPVAAILLGTVLALLRRRRIALERALAELARERDRVRNALEGSSLTIWDWDIAGGLHVAQRQLEGHARRPRPGKRTVPVAELLALVHPDDLERVRKAGTEALKGTAGEFDAEFRVLCVDGATWRWIRSRGKVTARDERGRATRASGTNADITARKRAEKSLAESEARFRALTELSSDMYWEQDEHFHLVTWSAPAWTRGRDSILPRPALDAPELTGADWERASRRPRGAPAVPRPGDPAGDSRRPRIVALGRRRARDGRAGQVPRLPGPRAGSSPTASSPSSACARASCSCASSSSSCRRPSCS